MSCIWSGKNEVEIPSSLDFDENILSYIPIHSVVLDLGCGNGKLCRELTCKDYSVYGVDCSKDAIRFAKENDSLSSYFVMDASELDFQSGFFDFIIVKAVFTVIPGNETRKKIMNEIYRVLKKGGYVYIADFAQTWHNKIYYQRYMDNYGFTGEYGLFKVVDSHGNVEYMAKHFSQKEVVDLYYEFNFDPVIFETIKVKTRSNNVVDGYRIFLHKT